MADLRYQRPAIYLFSYLRFRLALDPIHLALDLHRRLGHHSYLVTVFALATTVISLVTVHFLVTIISLDRRSYLDHRFLALPYYLVLDSLVLRLQSQHTRQVHPPLRKEQANDFMSDDFIMSLLKD